MFQPNRRSPFSCGACSVSGQKIVGYSPIAPSMPCRFPRLLKTPEHSQTGKPSLIGYLVQGRSHLPTPLHPDCSVSDRNQGIIERWLEGTSILGWGYLRA